MRASGVVIARTLGEARAVIEKLSLVNWLPISPRRIPKNIKSDNHVLILDDFTPPDSVLRAVEVIVESSDIKLASVSLR